MRIIIIIIKLLDSCDRNANILSDRNTSRSVYIPREPSSQVSHSYLSEQQHFSVFPAVLTNDKFVCFTVTPSSQRHTYTEYYQESRFILEVINARHTC